ncbi:MAG: methyltransferase domain-containing protein [Ottowia sp.]|uniref:methyltransferase domain-containing protein n=1 Tax=Ottowia sp. TaxID=1898956 RepID=UPI0039E5BFD8
MLDQTISNDPLTQELRRIRQLIGEGQLQPAALALNKVQGQAPKDARVLLLGMRLADAGGNLPAAIQAARRALVLAPDWHVAQIELALLLARQQEGDEAVPLAMQALANAPFDEQVMVGAINTAFFSERHEQTQAWAEEGVRRFPDHLGMRLFLGSHLVNQARYREAAEHFEFIHQRAPHHLEALTGLLTCALHGGDTAQARRHADHLIALAPTDDGARYWHAMAYGQTPSSLPPGMVASLFDEYAARYDVSVVRGLRYQLPERVAHILLELHPDRRLNLLDLGCGTGLVGLHLGRVDGHIVGADLSEKMLAQAARHGIYSKLSRVNILEALRDTPSGHYEAITCADVLPYVGDLSPVIPNALRILKPGGHFIFSCEAAGQNEADLVLRAKSNRYAHKASAVERLCREAGFDSVAIEHLPALRLEGGEPLPGFLVTARKPAA